MATGCLDVVIPVASAERVAGTSSVQPLRQTAERNKRIRVTDMKNKTLATLACLSLAVFSALQSFAGWTISPKTRTVSANGGTFSITSEYTSTGEWPSTTELYVFTSDSSVSVNKQYISIGESVTVTVSKSTSVNERLFHVYFRLQGSTSVWNAACDITQSGKSAIVSCSKTSFEASGGSGTLTVSVDSGVSWGSTYAVENYMSCNWITFSANSGSGSGSVNFTVAANTGDVRQATLHIAGKTVTITQAKMAEDPGEDPGDDPGTTGTTVDLSELTGTYTVHNGDVLTGSTSYGIIIPDGATITLSDATISIPEGGDAPAIDCSGSATIILADETVNVVSNVTYYAIRVNGTAPTLTIKGSTGRLVAENIVEGENTDCGIVFEGGVVEIRTPNRFFAIGVTSVTFKGGEVTVASLGLFNSGTIWCGTLTVESTISRVEIRGKTTVNKDATQNISENVIRYESEDGETLIFDPEYRFDIIWLNEDGTEIETTSVTSNAVPAHAAATKGGADAPYRWVFTGWTPAIEPAVSNTTYTATFSKIVDLSILESDWTATDGDVIEGSTAHAVYIPGGTRVTINGVAVTGAVAEPAFGTGGASEVVKFAQVENDKCTITIFAEIENDASGVAVDEDVVKVYRAGSLSELEDAAPMAGGVTVKEKKSAVKMTLEVAAPEAAPSQFFKVKFGE